jgi:hypothetical protein
VRRLALALAAFGLLAGGFLAWARLLHGGPLGPIPGGALSGEAAAELPADWSFANREPYLLVESRAFAVPWSGRVWFLAHRGRLHLLLPAFFGDDLERRLAVDPHLRVSLDGRLYDQVAVPVTDDADVADLLAPGVRRQFSIEIGAHVRRIPGAHAAELSIYRLEDPGGV